MSEMSAAAEMIVYGAPPAGKRYFELHLRSRVRGVSGTRQTACDVPWFARQQAPKPAGVLAAFLCLKWISAVVLAQVARRRLRQ